MQVRLRNIFEIQQSAQESRQSSWRQKNKRRTSRSGDLLLCFGHLFINFRAPFYPLKIQCMTSAISGGVASHSSAAHPAVINRIPSSDNAARKQTLVHSSLRSSSGARWHEYFLLFMVKMCKSCSKIEEAHNAVGILCWFSNNASDLTPGVNHPGLWLDV